MLSIIKSPHLFLLTLLVSLFGCTKEMDITTTTIEKEPPQAGETVLFFGTVRDTAEQTINQASLRIQFKNFQNEIVTDDHGYFEIELPAVQEQGLVIAGKQKYNRTIRAIDLTDNVGEKNIYLTPDQQVEHLNLEVNEDSLFYIRGILVDQFESPLSDVFLLGKSLVNDGEDVSFNTKTATDGTFEIIVEQGDFVSHYLATGLFQNPCFDQLLEFYPHVEGSLLNIGELIFPISTSRVITPNVLLDNCGDNNYIQHLYQPDDINIFEGLLTNDQTLTFCDTTTTTDAWVYSGIMSLDKTKFNGQFLPFDQLEEGQSLSLCTPDGTFAELRSPSATLLVSNPAFDTQTQTLTFNDGTDRIVVSLFGSFSSSSNGGSYTYTRIGKLEKLDAEQNIIYQLDSSRPAFANIIPNVAKNGIITAQIKWVDGKTEVITIRFRI